MGTQAFSMGTPDMLQVWTSQSMQPHFVTRHDSHFRVQLTFSEKRKSTSKSVQSLSFDAAETISFNAFPYMPGHMGKKDPN